jgi:GAF domain-containing protein/HAMP domain-containing protein
MRIQTKLFLAFAAVFALVAAASIVITTNIGGLQTAFTEYTNEHLRLYALADDIRFYDAELTALVEGYLIDPSNQPAYDNYFTVGQALDAAIIEAKELAHSDEEVELFQVLEAVNIELVEIEEGLLANPNLETARTLFQGQYGRLKAQYRSLVTQFFELERAELNELNSAILAQISSTTTIVLLGVLILLASCAGIAIALSRSILIPLQTLIGTTDQVAQGNLDAPLPTATPDELGDLIRSFGAMVTRIHQTLNAVDSRNRDLQTVADVNAQISTILNADRLLQDVVDLTKERFRLYHSHIYLLNDEANSLVLSAGAGHVGRQMVTAGRSISIDHAQSIVARAAATRKPLTVQDVTQSPTFLPHPLLPDTHSELAVPLVARGELLGVLDVQSDQDHYFGEDMVGVITLLGAQLAAALSNARLYEAAERTSRHERALGSIERNIQNAADIDEILQTTVRELGKALRVPHTAIELKVDGAQKRGA